MDRQGNTKPRSLHFQHHTNPVNVPSAVTEVSSPPPQQQTCLHARDSHQPADIHHEVWHKLLGHACGGASPPLGHVLASLAPRQPQAG